MSPLASVFLQTEEYNSLNSRNTSTWSSMYGPHHRLSAGSCSWNMQQKGCFGGAPALASTYGQEREGNSLISHALYFHSLLTCICILKAWRRMRSVSARATAFDSHLGIYDSCRTRDMYGMTLQLHTCTTSGRLAMEQGWMCWLPLFFRL